MARAEPALSERIKAALLHWFNTFGSGGCGGAQVESMVDLWKEHVPALLKYLKSECKNLTPAQGTSARQVYEEAMQLMTSSPESQQMAAHLDAAGAANGSELEIAKFLLLFWHELCISDMQTIENSIFFMEQVSMQDTMGGAIKWMNNATENQDYNQWFYCLFESAIKEEEVEDNGEARTPVDAGDAKTPNQSTDEMERRGEDTFSFATPSNIPMRHSFYDASMRNSLMVTPRLSARRQLPVPSSEPRHFITPRLPLSRGSPIADQLYSPSMKQKRIEKENRQLKQSVSVLQEERDSKDIEVSELKKNITNLLESNLQLKSKLDDKSRDLMTELRLREEMEKEMDGVRKEKGALAEKVDYLSNRVKKLTDDTEHSNKETSRLTEKVAELEAKLVGKAREMVDLRDEMDAIGKTLEDARETGVKMERERDETRGELSAVREEHEEMKEDWIKSKKKMEKEMMEIETAHHHSMGEMNRAVMEKDGKLKEAVEALEKERRIGEECRKKNEEEMRLLREDMHNEKTRMIEEMKEKKSSLERLEEERERMDKDNEENTRELMKKLNEMDVKMVDLEGCNISLKQKLSSSSSTAERLSQEVTDMKAKHEAVNRSNEILKETIDEMEEERVKQEAELSKLRDVEEKNRVMKEKIEKLVKEKAEASEKAYAALLENDKFTAIIEKMRTEEEARMKEEELHANILRSEMTTANREKELAEEKLMNGLREREEERRRNEEEKKELIASLADSEEALKKLQFIHKNEMRKLKIFESEGKKIEVVKKQNEEMIERVERLEKELENEREIGRQNMDNVVGKKKEVEMELVKKESTIDNLNQEITRLKEMREMSMDSSMTTVRESRRGTLVPQRTLMDFDEEPTLLYSKSNLDTMKEKDYMEVSNAETPRVMEMLSEDKENDTLFMLTPGNNRRNWPVDNSKKRLEEIANRNAKTMPHMRSSHAVEAFSPNFSQDRLREGSVAPASSKKLKDTIRNTFGRKK